MLFCYNSFSTLIQSEMRYFLKIKHWQIFLFVILIYFSSVFYPGSFISGDIRIVFMGLFAISWNFLLGLALFSICPVEYRFNKLPYVITSVLLIAVGLVSIGMENIHSLEYIWFDIIVAITAILLLLYQASFPARVLKSMELNRKATPIEYGEYLFPFFIFMIGIWIYQPRVNRIAKEHVVEKFQI